MIFRQLFDPDSCTYSYLFGDRYTRQAIIVDPVCGQADRNAALIRELGLELIASIETHLHADHITGAWRLKAVTGCAIVYPAAAGIDSADRLVRHGEIIRVGDYGLQARSTPGHTSGCTSYVTLDHSMALTGDALLVRGCGRTDFQGGSAATLYRSVWDQLLSLPKQTQLYPGHDYNGRTVTTVGEERDQNPRLGGGRSLQEFVAIMSRLDLAYPKHIEIALPGNRALGRCDDPDVPGCWSFMERNANGARQVSADWVRANRDEVRLVDVRQEYTGPLGFIDGAEWVPLDVLAETVIDWNRKEAVVMVDIAEQDSDFAATCMEALGFVRAASMSGGMMAWET